MANPSIEGIEIVKFPDPTILLPFIVLIFVPLTNLSCFLVRAVFKSLISSWLNVMAAANSPKVLRLSGAEFIKLFIWVLTYVSLVAPILVLACAFCVSVNVWEVVKTNLEGSVTSTSIQPKDPSELIRKNFQLYV